MNSAVESDIRGVSPGQRLSARQGRTAPLVLAFGDWLQAQRRKISAKSRLGEKLMDERVHISSDHMDPRVPAAPWSPDGRPRRKVDWIKGGVVTFKNGDWTGATPGGLIRGPQVAAMLEAAE